MHELEASLSAPPTADKPSRRTKPRSFWQAFPEKQELNQYWYSAATVEALAREVAAETCAGARVAFLSTPSVYFAFQALDAAATRHCVLLDLDDKFRSEGERFVAFDFREPSGLPSALRHSFDLLVIDPPFVSRDVWQLYAQAARLLARADPAAANGGAKVLLTTIEENAALVRELLACRPQRFRPSIPHLVYQYALFANYASPRLSARNPELPDDED